MCIRSQSSERTTLGRLRLFGESSPARRVSAATKKRPLEAVRRRVGSPRDLVRAPLHPSIESESESPLRVFARLLGLLGRGRVVPSVPLGERARAVGVRRALGRPPALEAFHLPRDVAEPAEHRREGPEEVGPEGGSGRFRGRVAKRAERERESAVERRDGRERKRRRRRIAAAPTRGLDATLGRGERGPGAEDPRGRLLVRLRSRAFELLGLSARGDGAVVGEGQGWSARVRARGARGVCALARPGKRSKDSEDTFGTNDQANWGVMRGALPSGTPAELRHDALALAPRDAILVGLGFARHLGHGSGGRGGGRAVREGTNVRERGSNARARVPRVRSAFASDAPSRTWRRSTRRRRRRPAGRAVRLAPTRAWSRS